MLKCIHINLYVYLKSFKFLEVENLENFSNLLTLQQFNTLYPAFTLGTLRMLVFNASKNGFNKVIRRISPTGKRGRIFINVSAFFEWAEEQNGGI